MLNAKTIIILASGLVVVSLLAFGALFWPETKLFSPETKRGMVQEQGCVSSIEEKTVRGNSLSGLIEPGETVKILFG